MTKSGCVCYIHFGAQCPGYEHMGIQAAALAKILGREFHCIDAMQHPHYAEKFRMFFPGLIAVDDFKLVYPGSAQQMLASFEAGGPLEGEMRWEDRPPGSPTEFVTLWPEDAREAAQICLADPDVRGVDHKRCWMKKEAQHLREGITGYIARVGDRPVGAVEFVSEDRIPYPLPSRHPDSLFITCVYSIEDAEHDYRLPLLQHAKEQLAQLGYRSISAIAGIDTPYPNGPFSTFDAAGFTLGKFVGRALLRHKWEDNYMVRCLL